MTLEKLQRLYPSATSATWHQHVNADGSPGGWVNNLSHVDATAVISVDAIVPGEDANIGARANIGEGAKIGAWAKIGEGANIGAWAEIGAEANIGEGAKIGARAKIGAGANIGAWAVWNINPLYIVGTKHILCIPSQGIIKIGCIEHPVAWWEEHFRSVGRAKGYSKAEVNEYRNYIALAKYWMRL